MTEKTPVKDPVSGSGKSPEEGSDLKEKEIENRVRENLRAEYARKETELSEKLASYEEKIADLEEQAHLSREDKELLERLRGRKDDLDDEMRELETNPKYRAYNEKIKREKQNAIESAKAEAMHESSVMIAEWQLKASAKQEGIKADDLRKEINEIIKEKGGVAYLLPHVRFELAMSERESRNAFKKKEDELKKRELELSGGLESGNQIPREQTISELRDKNDTIGLAKKLGL